MKILINDLMQFSNLPDELKTPGLADRFVNHGELSVSFVIPDSYSDFAIFDGVLSEPLCDFRPDPVNILIEPTDVNDAKFATADYIDFTSENKGAGVYPAGHPLYPTWTGSQLTANLDSDVKSVSFSISDYGFDSAFKSILQINASTSLYTKPRYSLWTASSTQIYIRVYSDDSNYEYFIWTFNPTDIITFSYDSSNSYLYINNTLVKTVAKTWDADLEVIYAFPNTLTSFNLTQLVTSTQESVGYPQGTIIADIPRPTPGYYQGILSQPMYKPTIQILLADDLGNILTDDLGNEYYNNDFINSDNPILNGILSQTLSAVGSNQFDCLGIGGTDASEITINGDIVIKSGNEKAFKSGNEKAFKSGLYPIGQIVTASNITISHNGSYMGRLACGTCREMCISPSREPGLYSSVKPRISLSGQVIPSAGGYGGDSVGVDIRYKIDKDIIDDFRNAYVTQTMQGFPFFLDFDNEDWLIVQKFYGRTNNKIVFQSSINKPLFSKRFNFLQAF